MGFVDLRLYGDASLSALVRPLIMIKIVALVCLVTKNVKNHKEGSVLICGRGQFLVCHVSGLKLVFNCAGWGHSVASLCAHSLSPGEVLKID